MRPDTDASFTFARRRRGPPQALVRLDELAQGVDFLLGHNLIDFDLPHPSAANSNLQLVLPAAVATLRLNPLAFPRNPYHYAGRSSVVGTAASVTVTSAAAPRSR